MKSSARIALLGLMVAAGCNGRPSLLPNSDPALNRTAAEFAADAARRHPYKADAPRGGDALGRSSVDYTFKTIEILNYSDEDWDNVEIWVNRNYCVFIPKIDKNKTRTKTIDFQMLFDDKGENFSTQGGKVRVDQLEMLRDGKMYNIPIGLAD